MPRQFVFGSKARVAASAADASHRDGHLLRGVIVASLSAGSGSITLALDPETATKLRDGLSSALAGLKLASAIYQQGTRPIPAECEERR